MPLQIVRNDITKMRVDAIVNPSNERLTGTGGADLAIHQAAGPELARECAALGGCRPGQAKATRGHNLPARYVIHTVGPVWRGGLFGEKRTLQSCYRSCLDMALAMECRSVAIPIISAGTYRYPRDKALRVAMDTITDFLMEQEMMVYLVVYDKALYQISGKLVSAVKTYIDDRYVEVRADRWVYDDALASVSTETTPYVGRAIRPESYERTGEHTVFPPGWSLEAGDGDREEWLHLPEPHWPEPVERAAAPMPEKACAREPSPLQVLKSQVQQAAPSRSLRDLLGTIDESFSDMVLRKIDERGMKDSQCYKKANIDRRLFSKIRGDRLYKPSKPTALALAIALELSLPETKELLMKAGFALSHSNKFDIIVEYFIEQGEYNIMRINETLFEFDQSLLGA